MVAMRDRIAPANPSYARRRPRPVHRPRASPRRSACLDDPLRRAGPSPGRVASRHADPDRHGAVEALVDRLGPSVGRGAGLHARLHLLRASRGRASDSLPDPLAQSGARDAGGAPGFLALPELSRVPLGPSPLHARSATGSRALLSEARLGARVLLRA